jgi:hypothetical protein
MPYLVCECFGIVAGEMGEGLKPVVHFLAIATCEPMAMIREDELGPLLDTIASFTNT